MLKSLCLSASVLFALPAWSQTLGKALDTPTVAATLAFRGELDAPDAGSATPNGVIQMIRPSVSGRGLNGKLRYLAQAELAGSARLLDAEVTWVVSDALRLRAGQYRTSVSRSFITAIPALQLTSRSIVSDTFRAGRDVGLALQGDLWEGVLEYSVGAYNGEGVARRNGNNRLLYVGRVAISPLGRMRYDETQARKVGPTRLSIGLNAFTNRQARSHQSVDPTSGELVLVSDPAQQRQVVGADFALRTGPVFLTAEGFTDWVHLLGQPRTQRAGAFVQVGSMVSSSVDVVARVAAVAPDLDGHDLDGLRRYTVGANLYLDGNALKGQASYSYTDVDEALAGMLPVSSSGHTLIAQVQILL